MALSTLGESGVWGFGGFPVPGRPSKGTRRNSRLQTPDAEPEILEYHVCGNGLYYSSTVRSDNNINLLLISPPPTLHYLTRRTV